MNKQQLKKVTAKGDFIFHKEWLEIFQGFSVEKAGQIIKALADYAKDGTKPDDPELAVICAFLFANVDIDRERIEAAHAPRPPRQKKNKETAPQKIRYDGQGNRITKTPPDSLPEKPEWVNNPEDAVNWDYIRNNVYGGKFFCEAYGRMWELEPREAFDFLKEYDAKIKSLQPSPKYKPGY